MAQTKKKPEKKMTYADLANWPEDERWELIDGVAYDMTPAPGVAHADVSIALEQELFAFFKGKPCKVYHAPFDVRFPEADEADENVTIVLQPDILVVCDPKKLDKKGCRGAPDMVIEILSPATASKDCIKKRLIYEKHGVKEYVIIDPTNRLAQVYVLAKNGTYLPTVFHADHETFASAVFPGLAFDLTKIFPPQTNIVRESPRKYLTKRK